MFTIYRGGVGGQPKTSLGLALTVAPPTFGAPFPYIPPAGDQGGVIGQKVIGQRVIGQVARGKRV